MAHFNIGDEVIKIDNNAHGTILRIMQGRGRVIYTVMFESGKTNVLETDLRANFDISDPFERCKSGIFGSYSDFAKKNTTFKIQNSNNSTISSLKASKTIFKTYQFKPLLKFLNSPNHRLLVADEVGLGKTIEAGHIMLELKARKELKNVLIVCPKSLQEKWKSELYEKFGLTFKIIESTKDLIADLASKSGSVRAIINYEKIRIRQSKHKNNANTETKQYNNLIDYLIDNPQHFSFVLCDEAHKMRNRETQTYKGAEVLMDLADAGLFLTATPVMISDENLYNLLHLLDNSRFFRYDIFKNRMSENRPFVEAMTNLSRKMPLNDILLQLLSSEVFSSFISNGKEILSAKQIIKNLYKEDPMFIDIMKLCNGEDTPEVRARLQYIFSTMSVMNNIFSRTRKRDVITDMSQAERRPHLIKIELTSEEQEDFNRVIEDYSDDHSFTNYWGEEIITKGGALGLVQRKRQMASSIWATLNNEEDLDKGTDGYQDYKDTKVEKLIKVINEVFANGPHKIVVFALFRKTLKYLQIRLKKAGLNSIIIHGQVTNRAELLHKFKYDNHYQILLSSEVGSEGLDMQFCNSMVNYDLPWNPMVIEQRIGRIDRFGQKSPVVNIYNFVVANSIQEDIYMRLLERIGIFQGTIGDMEAILDAELHLSNGETMTIQDVYNKMEEELFTKNLTKEERNKKIAEVEQAIANEKEQLQHLQEGLNDSMTNDAYFQNEISKIYNNRSYVTEEELCNFVQSAIKSKLTTCNLNKVGDNIWDFTIPQSQPMILRNFLTRYCDFSEEANISNNQFKALIEDKLKIRLTFCQQVAYDEPSINYLNIYHPMIQACLKYFIQNEDESKTTFSYALDEDDLLHKGERYYLGIYEITCHRSIHGVQKDNSILVPILFNIQTGKIEENQQIVDRIYSRSQIEGKEHNATNDDIKHNLIDDMNFDFTQHVSINIHNRLEEEKKQLESDRLRNEHQTIEYYNSRMSGFKQTIHDEAWKLEWEHIDEKEKLATSRRIQLAKNQIAMLEKERDERLAIINEDRQLTMDNKILSINLITII